MNYQRLVNTLRRKAFDYTGEKSVQHMRILKEAKSRMISSRKTSGHAMRQEQLLFKTR